MSDPSFLGLWNIRDGLGRSKLVRLVSLKKVQAVLSQICDYNPVSVKTELLINIPRG